MKTTIIASALAAALFAGSSASAATVNMAGGADQVFTLHNVRDTSLSFAAPLSDSYANFGGYVRWSTRADGRQDSDGPWGTCLECGYFAGGWDVVNDPWKASNDKAAHVTGNGQGSNGNTNGKPFQAESDISSEQLFIDFGDTRETVYLWVRPTYGAGSVSYVGNPSMPPVPLPAGGLLLVTAIGAIALLRRRKTA